ncbi:hypothetical protein BKA66DRAFT_465592 [Pyrenochaeta sp. MPI-SDFR-AT-0127]|nr:hypothetical protein BKA66DRAFT_465592 [Pyrenochaeta sp. MPI-SDFR-AT-0127]
MDGGTGLHRQASHETAQPSAQRMKNREGAAGGQDDKRSKSGGVLGGLLSLRPSRDAAAKLPTAEESQDKGIADEEEGTKKGSSIATALRQSQGRKRTGSLRKAAMAKMRERSSSLRKERTVLKPTIVTTTMSAASSVDHGSHSHFNYDPASPSASNESLDRIEHPIPHLLASPMTSPIGPYASTTDEDEKVPFHGSSASSSTSSFHVPTQGPAMSLPRRRSNRSEQHAAPSMDDPASDLDMTDEWDYSETEWWGWVMLVVTWVVFVVVMGSCLGVWSWAWDVGETPYAPPELEDDATLPITGYYPALMVCTAVMSWVWVVVAWVGMKYFRHAKVVGEEG